MISVMHLKTLARGGLILSIHKPRVGEGFLEGQGGGERDLINDLLGIFFNSYNSNFHHQKIDY